MAQKTKKAKLAHEKRTGASEIDLGRAFMAHEVVELIEFQGAPGAVVVLDENGTKGIVDRGFITVDAAGANVMRKFANPATYDPIAIQKAVDKFQAFSQN
ncbi:MAG: hypothetical protein CVU56_09545 [Deltaproteobacteria bacterium HGW-Deltaproteobacteria-14]|jgi:hypothetical protein|nr:MAG: hypothetical protein CVU56_09545 [Deltaproteobacteria bacterium HGW-Deltaproteobacteria-14]